MNKEIVYTGVSNTPSDYDVQDGQLTAAVNMINEGRGMEPLFPPQETGMGLKEGQQLLYVHANSNFRHFIIGDDTGLWWMRQGGEPERFTTAINRRHIASIISVGNTLVISATGYTGDKEGTNGLNYFLWAENKYKFLGMDVPDLPFLWKLKVSNPAYSEKVTVDLNPVSNFSTDFTNYVFAAINPLIREARDNNKFVMPFFVRYAIRMFDGTLTKHSAPILMVPTTMSYPYCDIDTSAWPRPSRPQLTGVHKTGFQGVALPATLHYYVRQEDLDHMAEWADIISSIDIFVSDQVYTFDTNWKYEGGGIVGLSPVSPAQQASRAADDSGDINFLAAPAFGIYQKYRETLRPGTAPSPAEKYVQIWEEPDTSQGARIGLCPGRSQKLYKGIREESHFYLAKSIPVKELQANTWKELVMDEGALSSISAREAMTDDYNSHDSLYPRDMFVYNNRLNLIGMARKIFDGFEPQAMLPYTDGHVTANPGGTYTEDPPKPCTCRAVVFIRENGTEYVASSGTSFMPDARGFPLYLYYPNVNAYRMVLMRWGASGNEYYDLPLKKHAFLNGAYWFNDFKEPLPDTSVKELPGTGESIIPMPNQIYTSAVNNPFYFPVANILEVGTGEILALASMTKPVSTGQFGEFPLYVFTTEGIWALQVGNDGTFVAKQPVSRDVCYNAHSVTRIDNAVLFSTERGIMMVQGGTTAPITDILEGPAFDIPSLPHFGQLLANAGLQPGNIPAVRFDDYSKGCKMAYDYIHQRLFAFNPGYAYAYVFSFKTKAWGMAACDFTGSIQAYPDTYMTDKSGKILNLSRLDYSRPVNGLLITRPLKFQANDILKTLPTSIHRGKFNKGDVRGALYGSRDLMHWHLIGSSVNHYLRHCHGTPYKYFRFVINCTFERDESLSGTSVDFMPKQNDKLR